MNPVVGLDVSKGESQVQAFLDKGKPFRVAVIACVNKLLHWIYALLKSKTNFRNIAH
ncbi:hypothetical protein [Peribacillus loiseleuriae]|uniref:hypothetical protein n=1 Tax=Peribacillus loiseleuriae TaxID=1679170 RepID=UPI003D042801